MSLPWPSELDGYRPEITGAQITELAGQTIRAVLPPDSVNNDIRLLCESGKVVHIGYRIVNDGDGRIDDWWEFATS